MTNEEAKCFIWRNHCCDCQNMNCNICPYDYAMRSLESIDRITAERDAAIADLHEYETENLSCFYCKHYEECRDSEEALKDKNGTPCNCDVDLWEWRGLNG